MFECDSMAKQYGTSSFPQESVDVWVVAVPFVVSNVAMDVCVSLLAWSCGFHFSWFMPRSGLAGPNDNSAHCQTVSQGNFYHLLSS